MLGVVGLAVGIRSSHGSPLLRLAVGGAGSVAGMLLMLGYFRFLEWGIDRLASSDDDEPDPPDYLARVRHLTLAEAREQAEAILSARFGLKPQKMRVDLVGLPDGVRSLFERYSHIRPDHTFAWLDSGLLGWASWDRTLRVIGTDRDGLTIGVRPGSDAVYEVDWDWDDPDIRRTVAEYPSVYHWILANVWDDPEDEVTDPAKQELG
jgi:hypothetical protein